MRSVNVWYCSRVGDELALKSFEYDRPFELKLILAHKLCPWIVLPHMSSFEVDNRYTFQSIDSSQGYHLEPLKAVAP